MMTAIDTMLDTAVDKLRAAWQREKEHLRRARKNQRYWYILYCLSVVALWVLLAISLTCEVLTGSSVSAHLFFLRQMPHFLNLTAVRRTAETVGFGSILIAWLYASLDKEELGLTYSDLLRAVYPTYSRFVIGHLIAMLSCVWCAESGMLEGALLSLLLILMGVVIHWRALSSLVYKPARRRQAAIDEWNRKIDEWDETECGDQDSKASHQSVFYDIADVLSIHDRDSAQQMQRCFARALFRFTAAYHQETDKGKEKTDTDGERMHRAQLLTDVSHLWDRAAGRRTGGERVLMLDGVLRSCIQESREEAELGPICAGCVLWLYRSCADTAKGTALPQEARLLRLRDDLDSVRARFRGSEGSPVVRYIDEVFTLLVWIHFLNKEIRLQEKFFVFSPRKPQEDPQRDQALLEAAAISVFPYSDQAEREHLNRLLEIAYRQMFVL